VNAYIKKKIINEFFRPNPLISIKKAAATAPSISLTQETTN
jgi:hypothetical protein